MDGFIAANDALRSTAILIGEVVDELGTPNDFIGQAGGANFIIITTENAATAIRLRLKSRFSNEILTHYNFMDRQQGFIMAMNSDGKLEQNPLMTLGIGTIAPSTLMFSDIREITELAAEARRQDLTGKNE